LIELYHLVKRVIDFMLSLFFLALFSPFLLLLGFFIWLAAGFPIIFKSQRVGKNKELFTVIKFRTLITGLKRRKDGLADKIVINRLAEFMRDTHIDEVLQLLNVIKGDMALIGPRPLDVPRYNHLKSEDKSWSYLFKVKPGMTCINQIARYQDGGMNKARKLNGLWKMERRNRLALDKYYIKKESPLLDIKITFWTLSYLILGFFKKMFKKGTIN